MDQIGKADLCWDLQFESGVSSFTSNSGCRREVQALHTLGGPAMEDGRAVLGGHRSRKARALERRRVERSVENSPDVRFC